MVPDEDDEDFFGVSLQTISKISKSKEQSLKLSQIIKDEGEEPVEMRSNWKKNEKQKERKKKMSDIMEEI